MGTLRQFKNCIGNYHSFFAFVVDHDQFFPSGKNFVIGWADRNLISIEDVGINIIFQTELATLTCDPPSSLEKC